MALIRYPGSKEKLAKKIISHFPWEMSFPLWMDHNRWEYREPFFGAGAVGLKILRMLPPSCNAWINDKDYALVCLWQAVLNDIDNLIEKIARHEPSVDKFYQYKKEDGQSNIDPLELGFRKLVLHQTSFSGLGYKSGGPLGGRNQNNPLYTVGCRWSKANLIHNAVQAHKILAGVANLKITCKDFAELIDDRQEVFLYLDPPYFEKGEELYKYDMSNDDHKRLCRLLRSTPNKWILSYDDHFIIRKFYSSWTEIYELETTYSTAEQRGSRPKNKEILIIPRKKEQKNAFGGHA